MWQILGQNLNSFFDIVPSRNNKKTQFFLPGPPRKKILAPKLYACIVYNKCKSSRMHIHAG